MKITSQQIEEADTLLLEFCQYFSSLYGKEHCTANIHLHCHRKDCVLDYGPVYSFWLFGFERLNGIMGSYHTNNRNISVHLMHRLLDSQISAPCNWPKEFSEPFLSILEQFHYNQGSLKQTGFQEEESTVLPFQPIQECSFDHQQLEIVKCALDSWVGSINTPLILYRRTHALKVANRVIGSKGSRLSKSSIIFAKQNISNSQQLGQVEYYAYVSFTEKQSLNKVKSIWLAFVSWCEEHPCRVWYRAPAQVWHTTSIESSFISLQYIQCSSVSVKALVNFGRHVGDQTVIVATPMDN